MDSKIDEAVERICHKDTPHPLRRTLCVQRQLYF